MVQSAKIRVLFVDDKQRELKALEEIFEAKRENWEMTFCDGGKHALEYLSKNGCDVLVTAMEMPQVGGYDLLKKVKEEHPEIIRIVLSGYAQTDLALKTLMITHQYLHKPCVPEMLIDTIDRAYRLRNLVKSEKVASLVSGLETVPSIPGMYQEITEAVSSVDTPIDKIERIVEKDMGMATKILQVANSAYFGVSHHVTNLGEAISVLGFDVIRSLVLGAGIFQQIPKEVSRILPVDALWSHVLFTSLFAKKIAEDSGSNASTVDYCFMAGLLSKVGMVVLASNFPEKYREVLEVVRKEGCLLHVAEERVLGADHASVGGHLLSVWGMPDPIIEGVAYYAYPNACVNHMFLPMTAVHVANRLARNINGSGEWDPQYEIDMIYLKKLCLDGKLKEWESWGEVAVEKV